MAHPDTPIVFESGVLRFEDDGTLHVHLTHSATAPHPLAIQPGGEDDDTVGASISEVTLTGAGEGHYRSRASLPEAETLPEGLVLTFRGYEFVQVEMSGDVSVLMRGSEEMPDWFIPGKVHRFDGPDDGVRLWSGSSKPPAPPPLRVPDPPKRPSPTASSPPGSSSGTSSSGASSSGASSSGGKSGCGVLVALLALLPAAALLL
ncbi:MAG: hypothetical protein ACI8RZ_001617 [Myxococcota bacterium]|jgi:hypothetical protein